MIQQHPQIQATTPSQGTSANPIMVPTSPVQHVPMQQDMQQTGKMPIVYIAADQNERATQDHAIAGFMPNGHRYKQPTSESMQNGNWRRAYVPVKWENVWVWNKTDPPPPGTEWFIEEAS